MYLNDVVAFQEIHLTGVCMCVSVCVGGVESSSANQISTDNEIYEEVEKRLTGVCCGDRHQYKSL